MASEYGNDYVTLEDEEGNSEEYELVDNIELEGESYAVLIPAELADSDSEEQLVILKYVEQDGVEMLESVEDDDILEQIYGIYIAHMLEENDDDYEDEEFDEDED